MRFRRGLNFAIQRRIGDGVKIVNKFVDGAANGWIGGLGAEHRH
jgi:hypothetical protein